LVRYADENVTVEVACIAGRQILIPNRSCMNTRAGWLMALIGCHLSRHA